MRVAQASTLQDSQMRRSVYREECGHGVSLWGQVDPLLEHGQECAGGRGVDAESQGLQHHRLHFEQVPSQEAVVCNAGEVLDGWVPFLFMLCSHQHAGHADEL